MTTGISIRGGRIIDPYRELDDIGDLAISQDKIVDWDNRLKDSSIIDATGLWVVPGLVDIHVHLREPGEEHKEGIDRGLAAAAAGGFTSVLAMPNTIPPNDRPEITRMMIERGLELGGTRLYPVATVTQGRLGRRLAPMSDLLEAGAVAFTDDGSAVTDRNIMKQALIECRDLNVPLVQHSEDPNISRGGVIHKGKVSQKMSLPGWPSEAEESIVERDLKLVEETGAKLHICHISTKGSVALLKKAKTKGLGVTAEVTPHHLHLTDETVLRRSTAAKVNPPLRPQEHVDACRRALASGEIDAVATDHAPHTSEDKAGGFLKAAFGMVGLEISVPLALDLVEKGVLNPRRMIEAMSTAPARIFGLPGGTLAPGSIADVTLIDPGAPHVIDPERFRSKGRNTPFKGRRVPGRAVYTIVGGRIVFKSRD